MNKLLASAAVISVLAATSAMAQTSGEATSAETAQGKVKCLGIAKAGKNDCKSANGSHSCAGQATADNDANEWNYAANSAACTEAGGKVAGEETPAEAAKTN